MDIDIAHDAAGGRIVFQVIEDAVDLVRLALLVLVLHTQLVAVGAADAAGFVRPLVPDAAVQLFDVIGFLLPDPQQLIHRAFQVGPADGQDGKLL
ncbi:hypothetical protein SDC9_168093 [bioreactor metagenome]|uniref:Uncharacterized protein n=1 Tax=bioreactor metagenome TaxID=1076179 RepID=A0A645G9G4_9ZZZZ